MKYLVRSVTKQQQLSYLTKRVCFINHCGAPPGINRCAGKNCIILLNEFKLHYLVTVFGHAGQKLKLKQF